MKHFLERVQEHLVVSVLVALLIVEGGALFFGGSFYDTASQEQIWLKEGGRQSSEVILRLSDIDGPRIDDEAVMTMVSDERTIPGELWVFLLLAYGALLVFNFSYTFETVIRPQWGWEVTYTIFALWGWSVMDTEQVYLWFPFMIVKLGLIVFALYVSLLEKRKHGDQQKLFED